jgi:hypothetical protein
MDVRGLSLSICFFNLYCYHFSGIALYHLIKAQRTNMTILGPHLKFRNSSLSSIQYYRFMAMSMAVGIWELFWIAFYIHLNASSGSIPLPLPSWNAIHANDSSVLEIPTVLMSPSFISDNVAMWYALPGAGYLYFLLFGMSREVFSEYYKFWIWFRTRVLGRPVPVRSIKISSMPFQYARFFELLFEMSSYLPVCFP